MPNNNKEQIPVPDWYLKLEAKYLEAVERKLSAEAEIDKIKAAMMGLMEADGLKNVGTDLTSATYIAAHTSRKFNSTNFKKDYPELYEKYAPEYHKNAYLTIKLKQ